MAAFVTLQCDVWTVVYKEGDIMSIRQFPSRGDAWGWCRNHQEALGNHFIVGRVA